MSTPRFMIAKYIPDLRRMEPRNIGVIVWSPQGVAARFTAEKADARGEVDGRSLPPYIGSQNAYRQWILYWRSQLDRPVIEPVAGGEPVAQTSPAFLEALATSSQGNFVLSEGGYLLDPIEDDGLTPLTDYLFGLLVDPTVLEEVRDPKLDELCEQLINKTKLRNNPNFYRHGFQVQCPLVKAMRPTVATYEFNYAYKNGALQRLYHRVPLSRQKMTLKKTVHDAAWMFDRVIANDIIKPDQGGVLIRLSDEQRQDKEIANVLEELGSVTRLLDIDDDRTADEFRELAALPTR